MSSRVIVVGITLCEQARQLDSTLGNTAGQASSSHCLGTIRSDLHAYDQTEAHLLQALDIRVSLGLRSDLTTSCRQLGPFHHRRQKTDQALRYCTRVIDIADQHIAHLADLIAALLTVGEIDHHRGHHFTALTHLHRVLAL